MIDGRADDRRGRAADPGGAAGRVFENFWGNRHVQTTLEGMIERERIPQTLLFAGLEGLGKATLARRFAARLLGSPGEDRAGRSQPCGATWHLIAGPRKTAGR